jgi:predicted negative regulator of RcsB-dependent stress response
MKAQLSARTSVLFLVFVVLAVYYPAIFAPVNPIDDPGTISFLFNSDSFSLRDIFTPGGTYFRPLLLISFLADKYFWDLQQSFMHLENVLFHLLNVLMLFAIARNCSVADGRRAPLLPLIAALLFALHPINTEPVNWISGRTDLLACFFVLLCAFLLLRPSPSFATTTMAALCLLTACLAKETAIFFLPAALLVPFFWDRFGRGVRSVRETALESWPHFTVFAATGAGFFLFRSLASRQGDAGVALVVSHVAGGESSERLVNLRLLLKAAGFYLKKLFVPFPLNFGIMQVSDLYLPVGVLLCILLLWLLTRRTLAAYFFICAASVSGAALLIPLLNVTWTPLAERYMYIPSAFFVLGMVFALQRWAEVTKGQRLLTVAAVTVLIVACYGTARRTLLWQDNLALFQDTLEKSPQFVPAQNEIANALLARGETRKASEIKRSMQLSSSLVNYQYGTISKASSLAQDGDLDGAERMLNQVLKDPGNSEVVICGFLLKVYELKIAKKTTTRALVYDDSIRLLSRLYQLTGDPFYLYRKGIVHMTHKERTLARENFQLAAAKAPPNAVYRLPAQKLSQKMTD